MANRTTISDKQRELGAFYTSKAAANLMAEWILRTNDERVLEPSFGDGVFLRALAEVGEFRGQPAGDFHGVELDGEAFETTINAGLIPRSNAKRADFLSLTPFPVDAVVGNPPYVRLRHLPDPQATCAMAAAESVLGKPMDPSGSIWMPFVLHATKFLKPGGRLALVLPFELTHVRYARPLWRVLAESFASLRIVRVHERLFPEILQDVVVLFADGFGQSTTNVHYQAFEQLDNLLSMRPCVDSPIPIADIVRGERPFLRAHLSVDLRSLLDRSLHDRMARVAELCTFNIGYVSGHKEFFHPVDDTRRRFGLSSNSLRPTITSSRQLRSLGLYTSAIPQTDVDRLFFPANGSQPLSKSDQEYVTYGRELGVDKRYKCRVRSPWYSVPGVRIPDFTLTVFSERPVLTVNDGAYAATNSLLCGFLREGSRETFVASWYTSLTLLHCEIEVHSLGGGVLILVPRETGNVRVPLVAEIPTEHCLRVDQLLKLGDVEGAYRLGDELVLKEILGLTINELGMIRDGVRTLTHWRTSSRGGVKESALGQDSSGVEQHSDVGDWGWTTF